MTTRYVWASALTAALIVYGSLSPFDWYAGAAADPLLYLLSRWDTPGQTLTGFVANIVLYLPLGLFGALALGPSAGRSYRLLGPTLVGALLCIGVELVQVYDWSRQSTLTDVYLNVIGTLIGAELACRLPPRLQRPIGDLRQVGAILLLVAFGVTELYPFTPSLDTAVYRHALGGLWRHPLHAATIAVALAHWLLAAALIERIFPGRDARVALGVLMLGMFVGQVVIPGHRLSPSEWTAVAMTLPLAAWGARRPPGHRDVLLFVGVAAAIALGQATAPHHVTLWPFVDLAGQGDVFIARRIVALCYAVGGLVWLAHQAGARPLRAGLAAAGVLAAVSLALLVLQTGRASTTPGVLALCCGLLLAGLPESRYALSGEGTGAKRSNSR